MSGTRGSHGGDQDPSARGSQEASSAAESSPSVHRGKGDGGASAASIVSPPTSTSSLADDDLYANIACTD